MMLKFEVVFVGEATSHLLYNLVRWSMEPSQLIMDPFPIPPTVLKSMQSCIDLLF
jgi:hypothetical protein